MELHNDQIDGEIRTYDKVDVQEGEPVIQE